MSYILSHIFIYCHELNKQAKQMHLKFKRNEHYINIIFFSTSLDLSKKINANKILKKVSLFIICN